MRKLTLFVFAVLLAGLVGSLFAQTQFGTVSGDVVDEKGARIPDVKVTLANVATGIKAETVSNKEGLFTIGNVAAGNYNITLSKEGFKTLTQPVHVAVAQTWSADFTMRVGAISETITVTAEAAAVNTTSAELTREVSNKEIMSLPLLNMDPYSLMALAPGSSDAARATGDTRGEGLAVGGLRTSDVNFMLDGGENNDTFVAGVGQVVPLDSVQEFRVQSHQNTAEFGRNPVVTNVITKSGSNRFHGSAYEYYRGASLVTNTYQDNATDTPKSNFVRNQFGGSIGGPIIKDKTFFFGSIEATRVRSSTNNFYYLPTTNWMNNASASAQGFVNAFGGPPASNCARGAITAQQIVEDFEGGGAGSYAGSPLRNANTAAVIPAGTQLFCLGTYRAPADAGGGAPQNTWLWTGRVDHHFSDRTALLARYAFDKTDFFPGTISFSPYPGFNTGQATLNQNINATLTHTFSPRLVSETRAIYNRIHNDQPLGAAPGTTPCWQYANFNAGAFPITFPGYVASDCSFAGIPFGGPQNIYQFASGWTLSKGKHTWKWGGSYLHLRDNRTFGAYENGWLQSATMQDMLAGNVNFADIAINPKGHVPGDTYNTAVDGAITAPLFGRHFHYNEFAFYGEDTFRVTSRLTLTLGLRWEYFGVLHSPQPEQFLDANLFLGAVGDFAANSTFFKQIENARFERTNHFYKSDYGDYAPRIGFAWDVFGNGRTALRGGYGLYYSRNFGNAVFNAIQNPPNYMTVALQTNPGDSTYQINPNQFVTLAPGGVISPMTSSARALSQNMKTAYTEQWNLSAEHDIGGKGMVASLTYLGTNGIHLYSLSDLSFRGSCLLDPTLATCSTGNTGSRLNQTGLRGMNIRGNLGASRYNGLEAGFRTRTIGTTGLSFNANYTWAHSFDNESSFFADSSFEAVAGFGFRNPFQAGLDMAPSANDIRNRFTTAVVWDLPWGRHATGAAGKVFGGWSFSGTIIAQSGGAFSEYEPFGAGIDGCTLAATNFCYPVQVGPTPGMAATPTGDPNSFALYTLGANTSYMTMDDYCTAHGNTVGGVTYGSSTMCTQAIQALNPQLETRPHTLRTPGFYDTTFAILKDFALPREGTKLQFRAEFFNLLNHSNLYAQPGTGNYSGPGSTPVIAKKGLPPALALSNFFIEPERRNIQLALRFMF